MIYLPFLYVQNPPCASLTGFLLLIIASFSVWKIRCVESPRHPYRNARKDKDKKNINHENERSVRCRHIITVRPKRLSHCIPARTTMLVRTCCRYKRELQGQINLSC